MSVIRCVFAGVLLLGLSMPVYAQTVEHWTEGPGRLGLGYPVPVPVDTPLPFDGFRTYAGLHARHQDLALQSALVAGQITGQTRYGRDIWAYRLGTTSPLTPEGLPKAALMYAGTVHAREWQSPEVVTGLMELMAGQADDDHWLSYISEHASVLVVPVVNIDGFLMTQNNPDRNWMGMDPRWPDHWPRDGRMRRKNLRSADENFYTASDHLLGVDLNRNNPPFWGAEIETSNPNDLVYRGPFIQSEPEIEALRAAMVLIEDENFRFFADMHSYTQVYFSVHTGNAARNRIQTRLLGMITNHHAALPGNRVYQDVASAPNTGIGTTSEYFGHSYSVPSLTWEIEPGNNGGAEYGGFRSNSHDGFILPESQIRRVRENLAKSMATAAYHMTGPPHVTAASIYHEATGTLVWSGHWSSQVEGERTLTVRTMDPLQPGQDYRLWVGFSKPMRWRTEGDVVPFPGMSSVTTSVHLGFHGNGQPLNVSQSSAQWHDQPGPAPAGYQRYRDDAWSTSFRIDETSHNAQLIAALMASGDDVILSIDAYDLTGHRLDADPATPVHWVNGAWAGYDSHLPNERERGGIDTRMHFPVTLEDGPGVFSVTAANSGAWFDPSRSGEGWMLEILNPDRALAYWFTYDEHGNQRWLIGEGTVTGNRIDFPELLVTHGGRFGESFDPESVIMTPAGSATMVFEGCDAGWLSFSAFGQTQVHELVRLSRVEGLECQGGFDLPEPPIDGSWFDPATAGQGITLHRMVNGELLAIWFSYDTDGNQYWMMGQAPFDGHGASIEAVATVGGRFGSEFDPAEVAIFDWGTLELSLDCEGGVLRYDSALESFGSGEMPLVQLSTLAESQCD